MASDYEETHPKREKTYRAIRHDIPNENKIVSAAIQEARKHDSECGLLPNNNDVRMFCKGANWMKEQLTNNDKVNVIPEKQISMEEVVLLNYKQQEGKFHPYTCKNRSDHPTFNGDKGVLIATIYGWICPFCDYKQTIK